MQAALDELSELGERASALGRHEPRLSDFFAGADEAEGLVLTRAPGRLDVLGGIADYSGSLVLEQPIREATRVAAARTGDDTLRVASIGAALREVRLPARAFFEACTSLSGAHDYFAALAPGARWATYALGGLAVLAAERGVAFTGGLRVLVDSAVPEGKGVSSSAAMEVATLRAFAELWGVAFSGRELGLACQRIENQVVGAPCGVMDQMTSACGEAGRLLAILCQPAEVQGSIAVPEGLCLFGIDSGLRHAVVGADYAQARAAAFMGLRILAERLGARPVRVGPGRVVLEGDPLGGYLANLRPSQLTPELIESLPERVSGAAFLTAYGGLSDPFTRIEPAAHYMVRAASLHPIYEHERARELSARLATARSAGEQRELGQLLYASHASYSACGLGSAGTDLLVEQVRRAGPESGLFGAKITGGGSGGTVAILARADATATVSALAEAYASATGRAAHVFAGSSPGALRLPALRKKLTL